MVSFLFLSAAKLGRIMQNGEFMAVFLDTKGKLFICNLLYHSI